MFGEDEFFKLMKRMKYQTAISLGIFVSQDEVQDRPQIQYIKCHKSLNIEGLRNRWIRRFVEPIYPFCSKVVPKMTAKANLRIFFKKKDSCGFIFSKLCLIHN